MGQPIVRYESGQTSYPFEVMTDSGDSTTLAASFSPLSRAAGFAPVVAPYGVSTGGAITVGSSDDQVNVAAMSLIAPGMTGADSNGVVTVSSTSGVSVSRGSGANDYMITSITVDISGAVAAVAGTEGAAFSETRGAAGGPPFIPVDSVEVGQVRLDSETAAAVVSGEIFQVPGAHLERSSYPTYSVDYVNGEVDFVEALPAIHAGGVPKRVYIMGATPLFAPVPKAADWVPADATYSISSTDTYDGPVGSSSSSLGQASFTAILEDGISDSFLALKGSNIWVEFRPDRDALLPKQLTQGIFGVSRTFPAGGGAVTASCTVTPQTATEDVVA